MARTKKQHQGDYGETEAIVEDMANDYEIKEVKRNNKGFDYKRKKIDWDDGGIA